MSEGFPRKVASVKRKLVIWLTHKNSGQLREHFSLLSLPLRLEDSLSDF